MSDKTNAIRIKNFLKLVEQHFEGSINAFATANDISPNPYYMIINGTRPFGVKAAKTVELIFKLQPGQLDAENCISSHSTVAQLPVYGNRLSAGNGNTIFDEEIIRYHAVDRNDIKTFGWKEENLCIFEVYGDSMTPKLYEGQKVIVDTAQSDIIDNRIYAISVHNDIFIKKLFKDIGSGSLIARSENTAYPEKNFTQNDEVKIIGRVVYLLGQAL
ncbi:MAG: helix-turn-helix transcriptional regulator [Burkholderiales bacterium]|nr:helix-turn-helix transcriptional regulator [Burkholderiales bacterium]